MLFVPTASLTSTPLLLLVALIDGVDPFFPSFLLSCFRAFAALSPRTVQHNFIQGRRTANVVAACLYVVCRRAKVCLLLQISVYI